MSVKTNDQKGGSVLVGDVKMPANIDLNPNTERRMTKIKMRHHQQYRPYGARSIVGGGLCSSFLNITSRWRFGYEGLSLM